MRLNIVVATLALSASAGAAAPNETSSGNYYLPHCQQSLPNAGTFFDGICSGYVAGLTFATSGQLFCPPNAVTVEQGIRVVVNFLQSNPQRLHEPFGALALAALAKAWPCRK